MEPAKGKLKLDDLKALAQQGQVDTVIMMFTDLYGRFLGKRYDVEFFLEEAVESGSHCCDYLLTADMDMEPVQGYAFSNWDRGYGDFHLVPDFSSLRLASWLESTALVICDVHQNGELLPIAPRSILKIQLQRLAKLGLTAKAASELEYYLYQNTYQEAAAQRHQGLEPAGWYLEDYHILQGTRQEKYHGAARRHLRDSGIPVENSKGEWGKGQHELNIRYAELLEMADRHVIMKQCMKELAEQQGHSVTFMAKPHAEQAGSSCHIHLSLWQKDKNAFVGDQALGNLKVSQCFASFLAGWMKHAPEMMVCYGPTINSYKRFQSGSWAPTKIAWSYDNRTAGFRVVGKGQSLRIECRIPGADCNPYLAYAAALASGLSGLEQDLEPPPMFEGDLYQAQGQQSLPLTLEAAQGLFAESKLAGIAFGETTRSHLAHFFSIEVKAFQAAVTDWERNRYYEQI